MPSWTDYKSVLHRICRHALSCELPSSGASERNRLGARFMTISDGVRLGVPEACEKAGAAGIGPRNSGLSQPGADRGTDFRAVGGVKNV